MDVHVLIQREKGTELSSDIRLDLLKEIYEVQTTFPETWGKTIKAKKKKTDLAVTSNFDRFVFVPGVGQVSCLCEG